MAITQLYKRFTRLDSLIKYVMNGDKTVSVVITFKENG